MQINFHSKGSSPKSCMPAIGGKCPHRSSTTPHSAHAANPLQMPQMNVGVLTEEISQPEAFGQS